MNYNRKAILKGGKWKEIACLISDFYIATVIGYHEESPGGQTYKSMEQKSESRNELYRLSFDECEKHLSGEDLLSTWHAATTLKNKQINAITSITPNPKQFSIGHRLKCTI